MDDNFLVEESKFFDTRIDSINLNFIDDIARMTEILYESYDDEREVYYFKESKDDTFIAKFKKFIASIVTSLTRLMQDISLEVETKITKVSYELKLRNMYRKAKKKQDNGIAYMTVPDFKLVEKTYLKACDDLRKYSIKFYNVSYKRTTDIDKDIMKFQTLYEYYDEELDEAYKAKVEDTPENVMLFIEKELSNQSNIVNSVVNLQRDLQSMKNKADIIEKNRNILGPDIISKKTSFIRSMITDITRFIKKWVVKIIRTFVFIVG